MGEHLAARPQLTPLAAFHLPGGPPTSPWTGAPDAGAWPAAGPWTLTTNRLLTFSRMRFSLRAMDSPFRFLILFFSRRLQAYIFPVARTWQAHTWGARKGHVRPTGPASEAATLGLRPGD